MKTLCVSKIPPEYNSEQHVLDFFNKFGQISKVIMQYNNDPNSCLIEFAEHSGAKSAYSSPDVVFGNRFVKLYWIRSSKLNDFQNSVIENDNLKTDNTTVDKNQDDIKDTNVSNEKKIITKQDALFVSEEYQQEREKKIKENLEKKQQMKDIENKIVVMCQEEKDRILVELKNPNILPEKKAELTKLLKIVIEKRDSIVYKRKYNSTKNKKIMNVVKSVPKIIKPKYVPMRRKIDRRTTKIIIYLKGQNVDTSAIINAYKKFGKIISTVIVEGKTIILTYPNHKCVINATSYGNILPESVQSVSLYESPSKSVESNDFEEQNLTNILNSDEILLQDIKDSTNTVITKDLNEKGDNIEMSNNLINTCQIQSLHSPNKGLNNESNKI